jgi:Transglycosylase SLT domain/SPOR domain
MIRPHGSRLAPRPARGGTSAGRPAHWLRALACLAAAALLSACASHGPQLSAQDQAARYAAAAHGDYAPPGSPDDPWGPYIRQASARFDVPTAWIRAVMHVESGGHQYLDGRLTTSPAGAMGLMQVMPDTYRDLQAQYSLGSDPYDPRNNIMAGTAYLREMYDIYGFPGFLAAYNAGPRRLDDYLADERPLPNETRHYVAMIAPTIDGVFPQRVSPAAAYAMNRLPIDIPPGMRYRSGRYARVQLASRRMPVPPPVPYQGPVRVAEPPPQRAQVAYLAPPHYLPRPPAPPRALGFRLVPTAFAEPPPPPRSFGLAGGWAVQVGAFLDPTQARHAAGLAQARAHAELGGARPMMEPVRHGHAVLWRARLTGLSREAAVRACQQLSRERNACMVLSPDAQS